MVRVHGGAPSLMRTDRHGQVADYPADAAPVRLRNSRALSLMACPAPPESSLVDRGCERRGTQWFVVRPWFTSPVEETSTVEGDAAAAWQVAVARDVHFSRQAGRCSASTPVREYAYIDEAVATTGQSTPSRSRPPQPASHDSIICAVFVGARNNEMAGMSCRFAEAAPLARGRSSSLPCRRVPRARPRLVVPARLPRRLLERGDARAGAVIFVPLGFVSVFSLS